MSESRENVALSNCDREPIHIPGRVQGFGSLLGFDLETGMITHHSENLRATFSKFSKSSKPFLNAHYESVVDDRDLVHAIRGAISLPTITTQRERIGAFNIAGINTDAAVFATGKTVVVEMEPVNQSRTSALSPVSTVRSMMSNINAGDGLQAMLDSSVQSLRHLTGHDRVMAYRFAKNGDGEVVAEAKGPGVEPYLGLRYPAWDIPTQVRQLMLRATFRVIHDIHAGHVSLVSHPDSPPLDLSFSQLRGVSPIHVEYLQNMGVHATMNLSIIVRGQLWGLFAFHHYRPRILPPDRRTICEVFGSIASMRIQQEEERERFSKKQRVRSTLSAIADITPRHEAIRSMGQSLIDAVESHGMTIYEDGKIISVGTVPDEAVIHAICRENAGTLLAIESLPNTASLSAGHSSGDSGTEYIDALGSTAGVLRLPLEPDSYLLFFRNETKHEIRWAGNKEKTIVNWPNGPRLAPRGSFKEYIESVLGRCSAWNGQDIETASEIARELLKAKYDETSSLTRSWEKQKIYQDLLIAELNHRVRNTLALVRSIARQTSTSTRSLDQYVDALEQRITALSSAHDMIGGSGLQWARIEELIRAELKPFDTGQEILTLDGPPIAIRADIAPIVSLLLHEMASNAVKHGALSEIGKSLKVRWYEDAGGIALEWAEQLGKRIDLPEHSGFGFALIERALPYECGGRSRIEFNDDGIHIGFWIPADSVRILGSRKDEWVPRAIETPPAKAMELPIQSAMIVEDNSVLAMELENLLKSLGVKSVSSYADVSSAKSALDRMPFECAVLDINLSGESSLDLAIEIEQSGMPLVLASGYDSKYELPKELIKVPRLTKPINRVDLSVAIFEAAERRKQ